MSNHVDPITECRQRALAFLATFADDYSDELTNGRGLTDAGLELAFLVRDALASRIMGAPEVWEARDTNPAVRALIMAVSAFDGTRRQADLPPEILSSTHTMLRDAMGGYGDIQELPADLDETKPWAVAGHARDAVDRLRPVANLLEPFGSDDNELTEVRADGTRWLTPAGTALAGGLLDTLVHQTYRAQKGQPGCSAPGESIAADVYFFLTAVTGGFAGALEEGPLPSGEVTRAAYLLVRDEIPVLEARTRAVELGVAQGEDEAVA